MTQELLDQVDQVCSLVVDNHLCIKCGQCIEVCMDNAIIKMKNQFCSKCIRYCMTIEVPCNPIQYIIDETQCKLCGKCLDLCPVGAIQKKFNKDKV
jgi:ferredoxin